MAFSSTQPLEFNDMDMVYSSPSECCSDVNLIDECSVGSNAGDEDNSDEEIRCVEIRKTRNPTCGTSLSNTTYN